MKKAAALLLMATMVVTFFSACAAETSDHSAVSSASSVSAPTPPPGVPAALTGREIAADAVSGRRCAAVMVSNIAMSRPQRGLSQADILFELPTEGGFSRFMALYEDYQAMPEVGPVRSIREPYLQLAMPFQPLFINYGYSQLGGNYIDWFNQSERMIDPFINETQAIWRDEKRRKDGYAIEHTAYTSGVKVAEEVESRGMDDARHYGSTFFRFVPFDEKPRALENEGGEALNIFFGEHYQTGFLYDSATGQYQMDQFNSALLERQPTIDEGNNEQVAFDNVLVLFAEMPLYPGMEVMLDVQLGFGGVGWYFNGGRCEPVRWMKQSPEHLLHIVDADGHETPVLLNAGTTYLGMANVEWAAQFSFGKEGAMQTIPKTD